MNRRTFLSTLLASPIAIHAAFKNLPKAGDPIQTPYISIDPASRDRFAKLIMVSTPTGDDRHFYEYMKDGARPSRQRMWMVDWEDITWGPAPVFDPNRPEFSS